jgi:hypothetical protein
LSLAVQREEHGERQVALQLILGVRRHWIGFRVFHPNEFEANEAWIAFRLNRLPICTEEDGDFNCIAIMDAASLFILSSDLIPVDASGPTQLEFRHLIQSAQRHDQELPTKLILSRGEFPDEIARQAEERGIEVVSVSENQLLIFTREARDAFAEHFEGPIQ